MRILLCVTLVLLSLAAAPQQSDDDLSRQVIGVWQSPNLGDAQVPIYIHDTFKPDHSVSSEYFSKIGGKVAPVKGKASQSHWEVEAGYVLIGKLHGHELDVDSKREIHVDAKGDVTRIADWTRVSESKRQ